MRPRRLLHLSDLHLGGVGTPDAVQALLDAAAGAEVDHVVVSGDVTNRGRRGELGAFLAVARPWLAAGRMSLVPGNHDRGGDDCGAALMGGHRVDATHRPGLTVVRLDSTGPHNRLRHHSGGLLTTADLRAVAFALDRAPAGNLVVLALHHHPLGLPEEGFIERASAYLGWPHTEELALGAELLALGAGRCDVVLHGHRHVPSARTLHAATGRPLSIFNAGCSPLLGAARVLEHAGGRLLRVHRLETQTPHAAPAPSGIEEGMEGGAHEHDFAAVAG